MSGAASRHATLKKLKAVASFVSLLLTPITAWSEWRVPETVDMVLGTESIGSERQAVLILSAVAGPSLCDRSSDLKVATKFDEKSALIEVLGYDFTPGPINVPCPAAIRYARTKVSLPNTWLKPD